MRLWHSKLIPLLDGRRLCDLHMSCCNLRGKGWGKRNAAVGYLYEDPLGEDALVAYHFRVLEEMERRGFKFDPLWIEDDYCGKRRERRKYDLKVHVKALLRNIPLQGHTLKIYLNDVKALQERGLPIKVIQGNDFHDNTYYHIYEATCNGKTTFYEIKLFERN